MSQTHHYFGLTAALLAVLGRPTRRFVRAETTSETLIHQRSVPPDLLGRSFSVSDILGASVSLLAEVFIS
jgi:hypothetical protein